MGETNPRLLALMLEDLSQDLERWGIRAGELMVIATTQQRQLEESIVRARRLATIAEDRTQDLHFDVGAQHDNIEMAARKSRDAVNDGIDLQLVAKQQFEKATSALDFWQAELDYALTWEKRAEQRVAKAERELELAQRALREADAELGRAELALAACASYRDEKGRGRNCSSERAWVARCRAEVAAAKQRVKEAQAELAAAKAELTRAQTRVKCTQTAVALSKDAFERGRLALDYATDGLSAIERSNEATASALRCLQDANAKATSAQDYSELAFQSVQRATQYSGESYVHFRNASQTEESAQHMRILALSEIRERIGHLYDLNRPDLALLSSGG